jgi:hypothetical protein
MDTARAKMHVTGISFMAVLANSLGIHHIPAGREIQGCRVRLGTQNFLHRSVHPQLNAVNALFGCGFNLNLNICLGIILVVLGAFNADPDFFIG